MKRTTTDGAPKTRAVPVRRSRHILKVVAPDRPRRQAAAFLVLTYAGQLQNVVVEGWSEAQWDALHFWERPQNTKHVAGLGWFSCETVTERESTGIEENRVADIEALP